FRGAFPHRSSSYTHWALLGPLRSWRTVIRKSCILDGGVFAVPRGVDRLFHHPIHLSEVEVTEQRRNHPALRNALFPSRLQYHLEQMHDRIIPYPSRHLL